MRALILAAGRFGGAMRSDIEQGREPRLDVFEIASRLEADVMDFQDADRTGSTAARLVGRALGPSAVVAYLGAQEANRYDAILTTSEDIGLPLAAFLKLGSAPCSHTMIAHTPFPAKKRVFFQYLLAADRIDRVLAYSPVEQRHAIRRLGVPAEKVQRIFHHADQEFFAPIFEPPEPDLVCAVGHDSRDHDFLASAVRDLPVRVEVAANGPPLNGAGRPNNVTWKPMNRAERRTLYGRASLAVVPSPERGMSSVIEMMAMGKCVVTPRAGAETDPIIDGRTGVYLPSRDPSALRETIARLLASPDEIARIGDAARRFVEDGPNFDFFVNRVVSAVQEGQRARSATA